MYKHICMLYPVAGNTVNITSDSFVVLKIKQVGNSGQHY